MRVNSLKYINNKYCLSVTFSDEFEEQKFLLNMLSNLKKLLPVNCMITELDTSYSIYEKYFVRKNFYVFDRLTTASIFAFDLNLEEIQDVVSNWGYITIDAIFALGAVDYKVKKLRLDCINILQSLPIVITQVLDNSIVITAEKCFFEYISNFLNTGDGNKTVDGSKTGDGSMSWKNK